uniref:Uncharacterized protein n=1 Tax=Panagrolaimus davidi TaxID=227884 RepID=A0A914PJR2_9BILA
MFETFPSEVKGIIKFKTFKNDEIFEKCSELMKNECEIITDRRKGIKIARTIEIHDGLFFESIVSFENEYSLCWHPMLGYKNPPLGLFWFQHKMYDVGSKGDNPRMLTDGNDDFSD